MARVEIGVSDNGLSTQRTRGHKGKRERSLLCVLGFRCVEYCCPSVRVERRWREAPSGREAVALDRESAVGISRSRALRETGNHGAARHALERAMALAPDWEAGTTRAASLDGADNPTERRRLERAAALMPAFRPTQQSRGDARRVGETGPALALREALAATPPAHHPEQHGVQPRARQLDRSGRAAAVTTRAGVVFGHYNLGHTFPRGKPRGVRDYEKRAGMDPEKKPTAGTASR